jgi:hypothetical protein
MFHAFSARLSARWEGRRAARRLVVTLGFLLVATLAAGGVAADPVIKVALAPDGGAPGFAEITNIGTITATNRLFASAHLPDEPKTIALFEVLHGAEASGTLSATTLVPGDRFFAKDAATGYVIVVDCVAPNVFALPTGSTGFTSWIIPGIRQ